MTIRIYCNHIRQGGLCTRGARQWFTLHHLDWNDFLTNGVAIETIEALNDAFGQKVAAYARSEAEEDEA